MSLAPELQQRLDGGEHEQVARELAAAGHPEQAAPILEQIWEFEGAARLWFAADRPVDALRCGLEAGTPEWIDRPTAALLQTGDPARLHEAIELLQGHRRHHEAARLLAAVDADPERQAQTLVAAGDDLAAAQVWQDAGDPVRALTVLRVLDDDQASPAHHALAAQLRWQLGDAEGAARHAQRALHSGLDTPPIRRTLADALAALGHGLAAEFVSPSHTGAPEGLAGRYQVTDMHPSPWVGATYLGVDRTDLREVEIHLLLADVPEAQQRDPQLQGALARFSALARAAAALGHPAIRPVLEIDSEAGLVVLPRASEGTLADLIRPPGMSPSRARSLVAFLLEGLEAAHARGLVHGWLLPTTLALDSLGRPLLGPFGAHHLAGLLATHTGGLAELMAATAPEIGKGGAPTVHSDLYAVGSLLGALLAGVPACVPETPGFAALAGPYGALAQALCAADPAQRPSASEALSLLTAPLPDLRALQTPGPQASPSEVAVQPDPDELQRVTVDAAATWSDPLLDALCQASLPYWQPIVDRDGRRIELAAWPPGCKTLDPQLAPRWRDLVPPEAFAVELPELVWALQSRIGPGSLVATVDGRWLLALDDLLTR